MAWKPFSWKGQKLESCPPFKKDARSESDVPLNSKQKNQKLFQDSCSS